MDDHELLQHFVSNGDQASFDALVHRYSSLVFGVCSRLLPEAAAAEDAVQATFIVLMRKADIVAATLHGRSLAGWLHVTAHRAALQMRRSFLRRRRHEQAAASSQATSSDGEADQGELRSWLDGALSLLSDSQREAILLRYAQGMSQDEAAGVMGCSRETVHTHVTRALSKLRQLMRRQGLSGSASVIPVVLGEGIKLPVPENLIADVHSACFHPHTASPAWSAASKVISAASSVGKATIAIILASLLAIAVAIYPVVYPRHFTVPAAPMAALPAPTRVPKLEYHGHQGGVIGIIFSDDGSSIASSSWDSSLQCWNANDGRQLSKQTDHNSGVHALAGTHGSNLLVTASSDGTAIIWSREPMKPLKTLDAHDGRLLSAAVSSDGMHIAIGALNGWVRLWTVNGMQTASMKLHNGGVWGLAFSPDGKTLATASDDHLASLWDAITGAHLRDFRGHGDCLRTVAFSNDGLHLVTGANDATVRIWNVLTGSLERTIQVASWPQSLALSPDVQYVATASDSGAQLWDMNSGDLIATLPGGASLYVAFSPDGSTLACGGNDGVVRLWNTIDLINQSAKKDQQ